jgi:hypothetical protein
MPATRYTIPEDVLAAHLEGEAVLLNVDSKNYYRLNETAARVFQGLERGMDRDALLEDLCGAFEVTREDAAVALDGLLEDLTTRGLVVEASGPEPEAR